MPVTAFTVTSAVLLGFTLWLIYFRFTHRSDSNWPLLYYLVLAAFSRGFERSFHPTWVYIAVVNALFLRFEFMGAWLVYLFRVVELVVLGYVIYRCIALMMMW